MKKILFTGGGSAGHVVPNIALIEEILSKDFAQVCYMGTNGIEKSLIKEWKIPFYEISCPKLIRGGGFSAFKKNLKIPSAFFHAVKQAKRGLRLFKPDIVFSKGGFVALPVVFACKSLKIPCYAHESDFSPGLANKLSSRFCKKVFTSFPETAKKIKRGEYSGAPMRRAILSATKAEARKKWDIGFHERVVLIFGGGSGSETINKAVRTQIQTLTKKYTILHVCGKGNVIQSSIKNYRQFEYISQMDEAYACADLVVSRAGAGTIFELMALKKPALFIPLQKQSRGDQVENAEYFSSKGLCHVLPESQLSSLSAQIEKTFLDENLNKRLAENRFTPANALILQELNKALQ